MSATSVEPTSREVDLRALVTHTQVVPSSATVEEVQAHLARHDLDFLGIVVGENFIGVCARRELTASLGSRFGFALNAKRPIVDLMMSAPLLIATGSPITDVFKAASARGSREFYDDGALVDERLRFLGMIPMRTLVRLQTDFLLDNIARVETSRREIMAKNQQMEDDLRMAREVQFAMLPQTHAPLVAPGLTLDVAHHYRPAGGMSGDFFDTLRISDHAVGLLIFDVMGHGVRSALITAMVRAMLEQLRPTAGDPGQLLTCLNRDLTRILRQASGLTFVTAAYAVLDLATGQLRYA